MIVNHPHLEALAVKARQARDVAASSTKVDKEVSSEIKDILRHELASNEVIVGDLRIILSETSRENTKTFKEELLKLGVPPATLEAAAEASKKTSETLNIKAYKANEELVPPAPMDGVSFY
jgi:hypothetical protein